MDRLRRAFEALDEPVAWRRLHWSLLVGCVAAGTLDAWFYRQWNVNPDGISYIDLARAFVAHGPGALVSGYWSPGFPALLGGALAVVGPDADTTYPLVRAVCFGVFVVSAFAYSRFVLAIVPGPGTVTTRWMRPVIAIIAWALFFLLGTQAMGMHLVTPDFGVAAFVFWIAAELIGLERDAFPTWRWIRLGAVLGAGYWWKAILFPVAGVAIACAAWLASRRRDGARGPVVATAAFAALALVLALPVSRLVGRATFGETGRLNQIWYVNHGTSSLALCVGPDAGGGTTHTTGITLDERLLTKPLTCRMRYGWPEATMPLWYDPSPWYRNAVATVRPVETLGAVALDVRYLAGSIGVYAPMAGIALLIVLVLASATRALPGPRWPLVVFAALPIGFYLLVYVELRHVVPFLLVLSLGGLVALAVRGGRMASLAIALVALATAGDAARRIATQQRVEAAITLHEWLGRARPEQLSVRVARSLLARGMAPGDRVATINTLWNVDWAHRIGLVVRAYVPAEYTYPIDRAFAELAEPCTLARFDAAMRDARIKGVVLKDAPGFTSPPGWDALGDTGYRLRIVPAAESPGRGPDCGVRSPPPPT